MDETLKNMGEWPIIIFPELFTYPQQNKPIRTVSTIRTINSKSYIRVYDADLKCDFNKLGPFYWHGFT